MKSSFVYMPQAEIDLVNDLVVDNVAENHCVPILSAFPDTNRPEVHYFVHDHPEVYATAYFGTVFSVLDFIHQIIEV